MTGEQQPNGLLLVDKSAGWTSHDVVAKVRGVLRTRKVGHSGTLDPDATGLLVLGVGRATRLLRFLAGAGKEYSGEVVLGAATTTLDAAGEVVGTWDMSGIGLDDVRQAAGRLTGDLLQVPPMVSAKKVGGRRLHELAREGKEIEREPVPVTVHTFDVADAAEPGVFSIRVRCSSGTYIRSLAADLGASLGGGAHLRNLRRLTVERFAVTEARLVDDVTTDAVLPPSEAFRGIKPCVAEGDLAAAVRNGRVLSARDLGLSGARGAGPWPVVTTSGELLAVYEPYQGPTLKPALVLS